MAVQTMESSYEAMYGELLQFLYRTPWGLLQTARNGDVQMLNPVAAKLLMPLTPNGRLDNIFDLLRGSRPELQSLVEVTTERHAVVCEDLPLPGLLHTATGRASELLGLSISIFAQSENCLMVVLRDLQMRAPDASASARLAELEALQNLDRLGLIKTRGQRISWLNPAAQAMLDYPARHLLDTPFTDLLEAGAGAMLVEACQPFWMAGLSYSAPVSLLTRGGQLLRLDLTASAIAGNGEEVLWTLMEPEHPVA
jgi:PAS domain-containing protein